MYKRAGAKECINVEFKARVYGVRVLKAYKTDRKALRRLARQHYRVFCKRKDAIHKAASAITKQFGLIGIESLNVQGMVAMRSHLQMENSQ